MAGGRLQTDPLFQGLTRPAMLFGVSYLYFVINFLLTMIVYINTTSFVMLLLVAPAIHGVGYLICLREPKAVEIALVKFSKTLKCRNRRYHSFTNSYDHY